MKFMVLGIVDAESAAGARAMVVRELEKQRIADDEHAQTVIEEAGADLDAILDGFVKSASRGQIRAGAPGISWLLSRCARPDDAAWQLRDWARQLAEWSQEDWSGPPTGPGGAIRKDEAMG